MSTVERREQLIQILVLCGKTSTRVLAEKLDVSERTVLRDIDTLSGNYPISVDYGRHGGYYITNYKVLNLPCMKDHEINLLQKITDDIDNFSICSLTPPENQLLKNIITIYSKEGHQKRKEWEEKQNLKFKNI